MAAMYQHKPCRQCGKPKNGQRGWYCSPCRDSVQAKYRNARSLCGDISISHARWSCDACKAIRRQRLSEAAHRGVATRRKTQSGWFRPFDAERFWQRKAHSIVRAAIKHGLLPQLKTGRYACVDCGASAAEYDHRDYSRPLDVQPVCRSCNKKRGTAKWPNAAQFQFAKRRPHGKKICRVSVITRDNDRVQAFA